MIRCTPPSGYGVRFVEGLKTPPADVGVARPGGRDCPSGAWVGHWLPEGADGCVSVVAPTRALAELILGSAREE